MRSVINDAICFGRKCPVTDHDSVCRQIPCTVSCLTAKAPPWLFSTMPSSPRLRNGRNVYVMNDDDLLAYVNGRYVRRADAALPIMDRMLVMRLHDYHTGMYWDGKAQLAPLPMRLDLIDCDDRPATQHEILDVD